MKSIIIIDSIDKETKGSSSIQMHVFTDWCISDKHSKAALAWSGNLVLGNKSPLSKSLKRYLEPRLDFFVLRNMDIFSNQLFTSTH